LGSYSHSHTGIHHQDSRIGTNISYHHQVLVLILALLELVRSLILFLEDLLPIQILSLEGLFLILSLAELFLILSLVGLFLILSLAELFLILSLAELFLILSLAGLFPILTQMALLYQPVPLLSLLYPSWLPLLLLQEKQNLLTALLPPSLLTCQM